MSIYNAHGLSAVNLRATAPKHQAHLENIVFADVTEDDLRLYSDACFLNLFRLSQLLLEYLLSVQDTLATSLEVCCC